jgi:hypothetical protein
MVEFGLGVGEAHGGGEKEKTPLSPGGNSGEEKHREAVPRRVGEGLDEEVQGAGALDFAGDFPVEPSGDAGDTTRQELAGFGTKTGEELRVFVVEEFEGHVQAPTREAAVGTAQVHGALWGFRLHKLGWKRGFEVSLED